MVAKIEAAGSRKHDYFDIIARPESEPLFTNQLLDFWSPLGTLATNRERLEVGRCSLFRAENPWSTSFF